MGVGQGGGKGEQSLLAASPLLQPAWALCFKSPANIPNPPQCVKGTFSNNQNCYSSGFLKGYTGSKAQSKLSHILFYFFSLILRNADLFAWEGRGAEGMAVVCSGAP